MNILGFKFEKASQEIFAFKSFSTSIKKYNIFNDIIIFFWSGWGYFLTAGIEECLAQVQLLGFYFPSDLLLIK